MHHFLHKQCTICALTGEMPTGILGCQSSGLTVLHSSLLGCEHTHTHKYVKQLVKITHWSIWSEYSSNTWSDFYHSSTDFAAKTTCKHGYNFFFKHEGGSKLPPQNREEAVSGTLQQSFTCEASESRLSYFVTISNYKGMSCAQTCTHCLTIH